MTTPSRASSTLRTGWFRRLAAVAIPATLALLAACGGGGGGGEGPGPGDVGHHFPLDPGAAWRFLLPGATTTSPPSVVRLSVGGTQVIGGATGTALVQEAGGSALREYYAVDDKGVRLLGNDDPTDTITPRLVPYYALRFPLEAGRTATTVDRAGLDWGEDLDGDGRSETFSVRLVVAVTAIEDLALPAGRFTGCAHVTRTTTVAVTGSRFGQVVTSTGVEQLWLAPGVGLVRYRSELAGEVIDFSLAGAAVGPLRAGVMAPGPVATGLGPGDSDVTEPGRPAVAFRAGEHLVVTRRAAAGAVPAATLVTFLDAAGAPLRTTALDDGAWPAVAWNGTSWLLTHGAGGAVHAHRLGPTGAPLGDAIPLGSGFRGGVASDGAGWLAVWDEFDGSQYEVRGALVAADGTAGAPFFVFQAPGEQVSAAVVFDGLDYLVAFRDTRSGAGPAADTHLSATRVTPAGVVLDPGGLAIATGPGLQDAPALASHGAGALVTWTDFDAGASTVRAARVAQDGTLLDGPASAGGVVVEGRPGAWSWPAVVAEGSGYRVAWAGESYGAAAGAWTARLAADAAVLDAPPVLVAPPPDLGFGPGVIAFPALASDGSAALVAWLEIGAEKSIQGALVYPPAVR